MTIDKERDARRQADRQRVGDWGEGKLNVRSKDKGIVCHMCLGDQTVIQV